MKTKNSELMENAKASLSGKWGLAIGVNLLYILISGGVQSINVIGWIVWLVIGGPFLYGIQLFMLNLSRNEDAHLAQLFQGFSIFEKNLKLYVLMTFKVLLWCLLLIIPGIIKAISYSQAFFLFIDDNSLNAKDALELSEQMMEGNKMRYFLLGLRLLGLALLCILTLGIGFLWFMPYAQMVFVKFYEDIKLSKTEEYCI
jgi:uncharacterized membrane protein